MEICVKNAVVEIQNTIDEVKCRIDTAEELINRLENLMEALSQKETGKDNDIENGKVKQYEGDILFIRNCYFSELSICLLIETK